MPGREDRMVKTGRDEVERHETRNSKQAVLNPKANEHMPIIRTARRRSSTQLFRQLRGLTVRSWKLSLQARQTGVADVAWQGWRRDDKVFCVKLPSFLAVNRPAHIYHQYCCPEVGPRASDDAWRGVCATRRGCSSTKSCTWVLVSWQR